MEQSLSVKTAAYFSTFQAQEFAWSGVIFCDRDRRLQPSRKLSSFLDGGWLKVAVEGCW